MILSALVSVLLGTAITAYPCNFQFFLYLLLLLFYRLKVLVLRMGRDRAKTMHAKLGCRGHGHSLETAWFGLILQGL